MPNLYPGDPDTIQMTFKYFLPTISAVFGMSNEIDPFRKQYRSLRSRSNVSFESDLLFHIIFFSHPLPN